MRLNTDNFEANQRLAMMFTFYGNPQSRAVLARSWAWYFIAQHPQADSVEVRVEHLEIPTIAQLKEGRTAAWVEVERTVLRREEDPGR